MKRQLLFLFILTVIGSVTAQNRYIARGAEPGELYISGGWYGTYDKVYGAPYYDTLRTAIFRLTENGKRLTIQYDSDALVGNPDEMSSGIILADATPGVLYNKVYPVKNKMNTALWVSFDYGKNWTFREENSGQLFYTSANNDGLIYRGGYDGIFKSEDYGSSFTKFEVVSVGMDPGLNYGEGFRAWTINPYQGIILHSYDFFETYTEIPIDSQFMFGQMSQGFPDVYRGGLPGEVYISSWFPDWTYKVSFSADTGHTFQQVFLSEPINPAYADYYGINFMSDREPGVFYIIRGYDVYDWEGLILKGHHAKICIDYYRDYGEMLVDTYCHELTKEYGKDVGIAEIEGEDGVVVYPNPTEGELRVESGDVKIENVEIFDLLGRNVLSQKAKGRKQKELDISPLPAGVYFVRVTTEIGIVVEKVVKR